MKKIINPWRNHPEYNCFGCCPEGEVVYFLMNQEKAKEMGFIHCEVEDEVDCIIG